MFDIFHYSLNPGGFLFLGKSESAEHLPELFHVVNKNHRIYQAKPWIGDRPPVPSMPFTVRRNSRHPDVGRIVRYDDPKLLDEHHQRTLEHFGPPSILVNEQYIILHVSETAGRYLLQPKGPVTGEVLKLVRPELQLELRNTLFHAFEKGQATVSRPVAVRFNGHRRRVIVNVPAAFPRSAVRNRCMSGRHLSYSSRMKLLIPIRAWMTWMRHVPRPPRCCERTVAV